MKSAPNANASSSLRDRETKRQSYPRVSQKSKKGIRKKGAGLESRGQILVRQDKTTDLARDNGVFPRGFLEREKQKS